MKQVLSHFAPAVTSIIEYDSTIQERFINIQVTMKPVLYFIYTDGQTFGLKAMGVFPNFGEKLSYSYHWSFPRHTLLSKVSPKCCTSVEILQSS